MLEKLVDFLWFPKPLVHIPIFQTLEQLTRGVIVDLRRIYEELRFYVTSLSSDDIFNFAIRKKTVTKPQSKIEPIKFYGQQLGQHRRYGQNSSEEIYVDRKFGLKIESADLELNYWLVISCALFSTIIQILFLRKFVKELRKLSKK